MEAMTPINFYDDRNREKRCHVETLAVCRVVVHKKVRGTVLNYCKKIVQPCKRVPINKLKNIPSKNNYRNLRFISNSCLSSIKASFSIFYEAKYFELIDRTVSLLL